MASNPVKEALAQPGQAIPDTPARSAIGNTIHLNDDVSRPVNLSMKQPSSPSTPGYLYTSKDPDNFSFTEKRNVSGVAGKDVEFSHHDKEQIVNTFTTLEEKSIKKTAKEMGFTYNQTKGENGYTEHHIMDKDGNNLSEKQFAEFQAKQSDNFNKMSKDYDKDYKEVTGMISDAYEKHDRESPISDKFFSLSKDVPQSAGDRTYQSDQKAERAQQQVSASKNQAEEAAPSNSPQAKI